MRAPSKTRRVVSVVFCVCFFGLVVSCANYVPESRFPIAAWLLLVSLCWRRSPTVSPT